MSGYNALPSADAATLREGCGLLEKPFTPETLSAKIREVLDAAGVGVSA